MDATWEVGERYGGLGIAQEDLFHLKGHLMVIDKEVTLEIIEE